jgi:hypothetical protein
MYQYISLLNKYLNEYFLKKDYIFYDNQILLNNYNIIN